MRTYHVYIMSSRTRVLYIGVTNNLARRVGGHKAMRLGSFTKRYNVTRLVYYKSTHDVRAAIAREKQLKGWLRARKIAFVESMNPAWDDLSSGLSS